MGRRSHRTPRCPRCRMHEALCVCDAIPTLPLATRLVVVMHYREATKTTATAPLALQALPHSALYVHGDTPEPLDLQHLHDEDRRVWLLFPADDAVAITPELVAADPRPVTLVVPDGSWRQASKLARRVPGLDRATTVVLPEGARTGWQLRREPRADGLATYEAIARALGLLEGPEVQAALQVPFDLMVRRTQWSRQPTGAGDCPF